MVSTTGGLEDWLKTRPAWLQEAGKRLAQAGVIGEPSLQELVQLCKQEAGGSPPASPGMIGTLPGPPGAGQKARSLRLASIEDVKGINALAPKKPLEFGSARLAIVYGETGSGKSGYVRILKHVCGAKAPGHLHGNVFSGTTEDQSSRLSFQLDGKAVNIAWAPFSPVPEEVNLVKVFDGECGRVYVNEENEAVYEPEVLAFLTQLTGVCERVGTALKAERDKLTSKKPSLPAIIQGTSIAIWYESLTSLSAESDIDAHCNWDEQNAADLAQLGQRLAETKPSDKAKLLRDQESAASKLLSTIRQIQTELSDANCQTYLDAKEDAKSKRVAADDHAKGVFANAPLKGVGTETWKALWEAARKYSESIAYPGVVFPNTLADSQCVLCQQPLGDEAKGRFISFEGFVKGELETQAAIAGKNVLEMEGKLPIVPTDDDLRSRMSSSAITDDVHRGMILSLCGDLRKRKEDLIRVEKLSLPTPPPSDDITAYLTEQSSSLANQAAAYEADAKADNREDLRKQSLELQARKWLSEQRGSVEEEVARLKRIARLEEAIRLADTAQLTKKKTDLAKDLITKAFINRFQDELVCLGASKIKVELLRTRGDHAHVYHQIKLKNASNKKVAVSEVLSEGEFRIVSFAAFLADVSAPVADTPLVFDDPVSSMDQGFEEAVARRLVRLSQDRQVIVFTHRLSLLSLLNKEAKELQVEPHLVGLRWTSSGAGNPDEAPPYATKPKSAINTLRDHRLPKAKKLYENGNMADYEWEGQAICIAMRMILERVIEFDLLSAVVERFSREVQTKGKIQKLARIKAEDCQLLDLLMTKYSKYVHSQPNETPVPVPGPDELEADLKKLKEWREEFEERPC